MRLMTIGLVALAALACQAPDATDGNMDGKKAQATGTTAGPAGEDLKIVPDIDKRVAQFAPVSTTGRPLGPHRRGPPGARQAGRGRPADERDLPAPGLGRQPGRCASSSKATAGSTPPPSATTSPSTSAPGTGSTERKPFLGDKAHPPGAGYYPEDMTKAEFEAWIAKHPGDKEKFSSTVTRDPPRARTAGSPPSPTPRSTPSGSSPPRSSCARPPPSPATPRSRSSWSSRAAAFESDDYYASRHRLDGPRRAGRGHHRPLRDLRGRALRLQGRLRGVRHRQPPRGVHRPRALQGAAPLAGAQPADPRRAQEPHPRHREPDPRRRHRLQRGRHPGRRADGSPSTCPTTSGCARPRAPRRCCCATS